MASNTGIFSEYTHTHTSEYITFSGYYECMSRCQICQDLPNRTPNEYYTTGHYIAPLRHRTDRFSRHGRVEFIICTPALCCIFRPMAQCMRERSALCTRIDFHPLCVRARVFSQCIINFRLSIYPINVDVDADHTASPDNTRSHECRRLRTAQRECVTSASDSAYGRANYYSNTGAAQILCSTSRPGKCE